MKYVTTKSNQSNFSQQELQFLNNFSSINDLYAFSTAVDKVVVKVDDLQRANPYLFYSLAGGLSGAGLGAIGGLMVGDKKKSKLRRMLEGGLIGGGLGAGIGALGSAYLKHNRDNSTLLDTNKVVKFDPKTNVVLDKPGYDLLASQANNEGFNSLQNGNVSENVDLLTEQLSGARVKTSPKGVELNHKIDLQKL